MCVDDDTENPQSALWIRRGRQDLLAWEMETRNLIRPPHSHHCQKLPSSSTLFRKFDEVRHMIIERNIELIAQDSVGHSAGLKV